MASAPGVSCRRSASTDAASRRYPSKPHKAVGATDRRPGLTASLSPSRLRGTLLPGPGSLLSSRDIGVGPIFAGGNFVVPSPVFVFVRDGRRLPGDDLFLRRLLRSLAGHVVARKGFRENAADAIGPPAVVFDDLIGDLGHGAAPCIDQVSAPGCVGPESANWRYNSKRANWHKRLSERE